MIINIIKYSYLTISSISGAYIALNLNTFGHLGGPESNNNIILVGLTGAILGPPLGLYFLGVYIHNKIF